MNVDGLLRKYLPINQADDNQVNLYRGQVGNTN